MIEDESELYDNEKEGGDLRNETAPQKRLAANSVSPPPTEVKKSKLKDETDENIGDDPATE